MAITRIKARNFKSFEEVDVALRDLNVVIGPNSAGKSNFSQLFAFVRDISRYGLDNAISIQGGSSLLRNVKLGKEISFLLEIETDQEYFMRVPIKRVQSHPRRYGVLRVGPSHYALEVKFGRGESRAIIRDELEQDVELRLASPRASLFEEEEILGNGKLTHYCTKGKVTARFTGPAAEYIEEGFFDATSARSNSRDTVLIDYRSNRYGPPLFYDVTLYDFDPKISKRASQMTGKADLESDGSNLAIVLKGIYDNKAKFKRFCALMRDALPYFQGLDISKQADKSLLVRFREAYMGPDRYLPSSVMSDGTIGMTLLIVALYFETHGVAIVEEPERNVHPHLMVKIAAIILDASHTQQIIVNTHHPELLRHTFLKKFWV